MDNNTDNKNDAFEDISNTENEEVTAGQAGQEQNTNQTAEKTEFSGISESVTASGENRTEDAEGSFPEGGYKNNYSSIPENGASFKNESRKKKNKKKKNSKIAFIAVVLVAFLLLSGAAGAGAALLVLRDGNGPLSQGLNAGTVNVVVNEADNLVAGTITEVSEAVIDTVVELTTETVTTSSYFGQYVTSGAGSGVVISADGYILTNYHVIKGATTIGARMRKTDRTGDEENVTFENYAAEVVGFDEDSDIAVIKIDADGLSAAVIGNSDTLRIGQEVIAIGNPLGELGGTVTNGIISALDREIEVEGAKMTLLQTNAAVNPGNSGGGLFDLSGRLVGIVNAKSGGTSVEGLGFAIPINESWSVARELLEHGYVRGRVSLNIDVREITGISAALYYQGYTTVGIYVVDPGDNTNLKAMDRIVALEGIEVGSVSEIKGILRDHSVGDELTMTVVRDGRYTEVKVTCFEKIPTGVEKDFETES